MVFRSIFSRRFLQTTLMLSAFFSSSGANADIIGNDYRLMLQAGPYVHHWHDASSDKRNNVPGLIGAEWENRKRWEFGSAVFRNSFYQPSIYGYGGRRWFLPRVSKQVYIKLTGGPLYGYKGEYKEKVPFNYKGLGLAILPALGYQHGKANAQAVFLGTAAVIFTFGYEFD